MAFREIPPRLHHALVRLKERPRWLMVFLIVNILLAGIELGTDPFLRQATFERLPPGATTEDRAVLSAMLDDELPLQLAFRPVRNVLGWGLFALCLYYTALAVGPTEPLRFTQVFALEVWAETILALGALVSLIRAWIDPSAGAIAVGTLPFGVLDLVTPTGSLSTDLLLASLNLFTLLYLAFLSAGMTVLCGFTRARSLLVVLCVWGATLMLNTGAILALRDILHLSL